MKVKELRDILDYVMDDVEVELVFKKRDEKPQVNFRMPNGAEIIKFFGAEVELEKDKEEPG